MLRSLATHVTLAVTLACFSVACASNSSPATPSSSSSSSSSPSTSEAVDARDEEQEEQEEQAVIDAYLAGVDAFYLAANPPDPDHPALAATHAGDLLDSVRSALSTLADEGHAIRRGADTRYNPMVVRLSTTSAVIEDCGTDGDVKFDTATGQIIDDSVVVGRSIVRLALIDGEWITVAVEFEEGPCDGAS